MVFQPMLELLGYLRANGYKTFIVSGGGIEFMRPWTERVYGIPPEQVIGSTAGLKYELRNGVPTLVKLPELVHVDDKDGKPVAIQRHIGRFGFDGYRDVGAPANTRQPARTRPDCQSAGSRCRRQPKGGGGLPWRHDGRAVAQQFAQLAARRRTQTGWCHALHLKRVNVCNVDVSSL